MSPNEVISAELAAFVCQISREIRRQVGLLIDRRGKIEHVIIGDASRIWLPDLGRMRAGPGRLRGLRLVHTHLDGEGLNNDDLTDLALLRLDLVAALTMTPDGYPAAVHLVHVDPVGEEPWTVLDSVPYHRFELDPVALVRQLETELARRAGVRAAGEPLERAILVHLSTPRSRRSPESCLAELRELCRTARVEVVETAVQRRATPDPRYGMGKGKLDQVLLRANQLGAELLVFDPDLTPAQARAISEATDLKVLDRSMLILDIFAQHAQTREGKLQVELAQLRYRLPRLVEKNTMMSRLTGGIGGRGPGETKLEINRRRARERIASLSRQIDQVGRQRQRRRSLRRERGVPVVSIVGYTNAGKSTLLNTLTAADAVVADQLFATLSPLSRRLRFPHERELVLNDTVGVIHEMPDEVMQAFKATFEELREADLLLHVVDVSDPSYRDQIATVEALLKELEVDDLPRLLVFNKSDRLGVDELAERLHERTAWAVCALVPSSTRLLLEEIEARLWREGRIAKPKHMAKVSAPSL